MGDLINWQNNAIVLVKNGSIQGLNAIKMSGQRIRAVDVMTTTSSIIVKDKYPGA